MSESYQFHDNDVIAPDVYERGGHPHQAFAWLRANDPIRMVEPEGFKPFWAITKHQDVIDIEKQPELFANEPRPILMREASAPEMREEIMAELFKHLQDAPKLMQVLMTAGEGGLIRSLVQMDPPDHTAYRALVQPWFKPTNIKRLEDHLNTIIKSQLDELAGDGSEKEVDFVQEVAESPAETGDEQPE